MGVSKIAAEVGLLVAGVTGPRVLLVRWIVPPPFRKLPLKPQAQLDAVRGLSRFYQIPAGAFLFCGLAMPRRHLASSSNFAARLIFTEPTIQKPTRNAADQRRNPEQP